MQLVDIHVSRGRSLAQSPEPIFWRIGEPNPFDVDCGLLPERGRPHVRKRADSMVAGHLAFAWRVGCRARRCKRRDRPGPTLCSAITPNAPLPRGGGISVTSVRARRLVV